MYESIITYVIWDPESTKYVSTFTYFLKLYKENIFPKDQVSFLAILGPIWMKLDVAETYLLIVQQENLYQGLLQ